MSLEQMSSEQMSLDKMFSDFKKRFTLDEHVEVLDFYQLICFLVTVLSGVDTMAKIALS